MSRPIFAQGEVIPHCGRGTSFQLHLPTRLSVRGAHGPISLGLIRDWVAGHAIFFFPASLLRPRSSDCSRQRDNARHTQWVGCTHQPTRSCQNPAEQGVIQRDSAAKPSDLSLFPPQRGLRRPALAQHFGRHGQKPLTARQLALSGASSRASRGQPALPAKHGQNFGSNSPLALHLHPFAAGFSANSR